ncbi:hypothetical protein Bca4012_053924 [Brassica carinata]
MSGDSLLASKQNLSETQFCSRMKQVKRLKDQLQKETALRALLLKASDQSHKIELSHTSSLPRSVQELLSSIVTMEATVSMLEEEIMSLHFLLIQERNERKLAEYNLTHSLSPPNATDLVRFTKKNETLRRKDHHRAQPKSKVPKSLQSYDNANELSKEMIRCMRNIFVSLGETSAGSKSSQEIVSFSPTRKNASSSSTTWWSPSEHSRISKWVQSPRIDIKKNSDVLATESSVFDPYRVQGKLSWADIGSYRSATEVASMSVEEKRLGYASDELWRFRHLVERLARVNPTELSNNEKLAFWINIYNALIMHALLLSILKLKVSEEQKQAGISTHEPLVSFALSCGMHSSPAVTFPYLPEAEHCNFLTESPNLQVRIYSAENVGEELEDAQKDYIQASVGVSPRGKLIVPKMLHCFGKNFVDDSKVALWISRHLPPRQAAFVEQCIHRRQWWGFLDSSSSKCGVIPFDSRFRYLFLP